MIQGELLLTSRSIGIAMRRFITPRIEPLEGRALPSSVHAFINTPAYIVDRQGFPEQIRQIIAPSGDFGTVRRPTLVQHPDPIDPTVFLAGQFQEFSYGPSTSERLYLAIQPRSKRLAFFIHGGGLTFGSALSHYNDSVIYELWSEGYSVASIGYPLIGEATWPGVMQAIADGMQAANKLAGRQITRRVMVGVSSGATAGALILYSRDPQYPVLPFRVDRFLGVSGIYMADSIIPGWYADALQGAFAGRPKTRTPAFIIAGDHDEWDVKAGTPNSDPLLFADYLMQGRVPTATFIIDGADGDHSGPAFHIANPEIESAYQQALG